ncbi:MAG: adenylate/guanylate cyclase domain-containing protein [Betaproteobacteria bacterium]|nr:adenylate/guanylate cyclase domain-containing protein [Betaproteobacteria bacterium]
MEKIKALWNRYFSSINANIRAALGVIIVMLFVAGNIYSERIDFLERLELQTYDLRLRATMPEKIDPRIVIIDVDEKTLAAEGRWPLGRDKWVLLLRQLFDVYRIKVVGFDVFFTEPDNSSGLQSLEKLSQGVFKSSAEFQSKLTELRPTLDYDSQFAAEMKKRLVVLSFSGQNKFAANANDLLLAALPPPIFSGETFRRPPVSLTIDGYSGNLQVFQSAATSAGHILPDIDFDGVLRRVPMFIRFKEDFYESFSAAIYRTYLDNEPVKVNVRDDEGDNVVKLKSTQIGKAIIPLDDRGTALVPFRGNSPMFRYISATDVMRGKLTPGELEGKIAIVGTSAQGLFDLRNTPVSQVYPGVEVHANLISGYMDNRIKAKPQFEFAVKVLTILLIGIPLALLLVKLDPLWATITVTMTGVAYLGFNLYWWSTNIIMPLAIPLLMIGTLYLLNMAYGFFIEARSKKAITGIFGTYVPKELVEEMAKDPGAYSTKGESRDMTVLFSDVRNFTSISEGLSATELTAMMNTYLTEMTRTIQDQRGTIDKYIGDAIMAFWGAPLADDKHAEHALLSAMAMQKKIKDIAPDFIKRGWPKLEIGVGLNCGVMNVGDMGSSFRRAYTVMGDHVNLAARLEGLTKEYGVGILVSENIVRTVAFAVYRELDRVRVKGKAEPVSIYEPVGIKGEIAESIIDELDRFHRALDYYRKQQWDDATRLLTTLSQADPNRKAYKLYLERIVDLRLHPPGKNWDGVFVFTHK